MDRTKTCSQFLDGLEQENMHPINSLLKNVRASGEIIPLETLENQRIACLERPAGEGAKWVRQEG